MDDLVETFSVQRLRVTMWCDFNRGVEGVNANEGVAYPRDIGECDGVKGVVVMCEVEIEYAHRDYSFYNGYHMH